MTKSNDQMRQVFINELRCHFNLRRPKSEKPTNIYMVVYLNRKQHYFATGVKVYPSQWNPRKQLAVVSNIQSDLDNLNNQEVNKRISTLQKYFSRFKLYICTNTNSIDKAELFLKSFIYNDMAENIKGTELLVQAFDYYYKYLSRSKSSNTRQYRKSQLDTFLKYVTYSELEDDINLLSQSSLNKYRDFLKKESEKENSDFFDGGIEYVNQLCQLISSLINNVLSSENQFLQYGITTVKFNPLPTDRTQEEKPRFPISKEEIEKIKNCQGLNQKQEVYRDLFLLQIESGLRVSDLKRFIKRDFEEQDGYINLKTKKNKIVAHFENTDNIKDFFIKYKEGFGVIDADKIERLDKNETYNNNIRKICEKAGLYRQYQYTDSKNRPHTDKICDIITNHCARHTFVVTMKRKGYNADEICMMTGHTDDKMVKTVYGHYGNEDAIDSLKKAKARIERKPETGTHIRPKVSVIDSVFGYSKMMELKDLLANDTNLRGLPLTKECTQIMLSTSSLTNAINYSKGRELAQLKEKALELYDIVKSLTILSLNPNIYHIYEYKLFKFGFIEEMLPIDMIEVFFREPTEEEIAQAQLEEHIEWLKK